MDPYNPYAEFNPQIAPQMGVNQQPNFSWQSRLGSGVQGLLGNRDLALALLANSGPSTQKRSFGQILGSSMLQADQAKQQRQQDEFNMAYQRAIMEKMQRPDPGKAIAVMGPDGKPVLVPESQAYGMSPVTSQPGVSGALYKYIDPNTGKPVFGDAVTASGKTPYSEQPTPKEPPSGYYWKPDGTMSFVPGGPADPSVGERKVKPTEYDKKAKLLFGEMIDAEKQYRGATGTDTSGKWDSVLNSNPLTRVFTSEDFRKHEASGMRWAQNFLYLKSGASAPVEEVRKTFVQYLPQPGDSAGVIEQKKVAREQAMANVANASGFDAPTFDSGSTPNSGSPVKIGSDEEYNKLQSGALYIAPDGSTRRKK